MSTLITSLIVSAAGGLSFLAYKHPKGYARIFKVFVVAGGIVYLVLTTWNTAIGVACDKARSFVPASGTMKLSDLWSISDECRNSLSVPHFQIASLVFFAFLIFLAYLPQLIADSEPSGASTDPPAARPVVENSAIQKP